MRANERSAESRGCAACRDGAAFTVPFSMAFQPIVDCGSGEIFAFEALVRGSRGESAASILEQVDDSNRYAFDQACRVRAIEMAAARRLPAFARYLSINFLPNAVYRPEACIRSTLAAASRVAFPLGAIIFELTEGECLADPAHLQRIVESYRRMGFKTAIDDFGAGYSGLNLLARFQPDIVKLDMQLTRDIDSDRAKRVIVEGVLRICRGLGVTVIAEGIETVEEHRTLRALGVDRQQGYLFAKPAFEALPPITSALPGQGQPEQAPLVSTDPRDVSAVPILPPAAAPATPGLP